MTSEKFFLFAKKILPKRWHYIADHAGFRRYFANTSWMFFGQMFSLVVNFFIGAWIARYLGPGNYGIINYVFAFVGIFTFIAQLGVATVLMRELARYPEKRDILMGTSFRLLLASGALAFILVASSAFFFENSFFIRSLIILYSSTFLWTALGIIPVFFQSTVQAKLNVRASMIAAIVVTVMKVALILSGKGIIWLILIFVLDSLLSNALAVVYYKKYGYKIMTWRFDFTTAKTILVSSWLMMLAASASHLFMKIDQVMVKYYLGEVSVGLYAAAVRLVEVWYFVPGLICGSLFPAIINAKKINEVIYKKRLDRLYMLLGGIAVLIAVPSTLLAPWVVKMLFGSAFAGSAGILRIYVWSGVGLFLLWGYQQYLMSEDRLMVIFYLYLSSMLLNIVLNIVLIPKFGLNGAAWATLFSYSAGPLFIFSRMYLKRLTTKYADN